MNARLLSLLMALFSIAVVTFGMLTLSPRATHASREFLSHSGLLGKVNEHLNPFRTRHALLACGLPIYDLKIKNSEYRRILAIADQAKQRGILTDDLKQWSKAKFIHNGRTRNVKIRLRGDTPIHWAGFRKSWRIRFKRDDPFDGQREINLIVTTDGKAICEHFTNRVFDRLGMMTLRDGYAVLRLNGIPQGVYYRVEHVDPAMLANLRRPDGTVFVNPRLGMELGSFKQQIVKDDPSALRALQTLLDHEADPTPQSFAAAIAVTDMDDYLRYVAGTTLFCSDHTHFGGDNHKLYYDPSRGQFARIPWDIEAQAIPTLQRFELEDHFATFDVFARWPMSEFRKSVLLDDDYRYQRNRLLWTLVRDESLLRQFDDAYADVRPALWADVLDRGDEVGRLAGFRSLVAGNADYIRASLSNNRAELSITHATKGVTTLRFSVNNASGFILQRILVHDTESTRPTGRASTDTHQPEHNGGTYRLYRDANNDATWDSTDTLVAEEPLHPGRSTVFSNMREVMLPAAGVDTHHTAYLYSRANGGDTYRAKPLATVVYSKTKRYNYFLKRVTTADGDGSSPPSISVDMVNAVTGVDVSDDDLQTRSYSVTRHFTPVERFTDRRVFLERNRDFAAHPLDTHAVVLDPGVHRIEGVVIVPEGVRLVIRPGAELRMASGSSIVCFGSVDAEGSRDSPIRIRAADGRPWGTFAIVRAVGQSTFQHVHFDGGSGATVEGITFTATLAVHDADVFIERCRFVGALADDAVNIKNGTVDIRETYWVDNKGDGMDLDFATGSVVRCHFHRNGGDALDLAGSNVTISQCRIERSGDKGISIGEQSKARVDDTLFVENALAIAVKDLSKTVISNCTFVRNSAAVAAYRKKPIFGGATAELINSVVMGAAGALSHDAHSTMSVHNCILPEYYVGTSCRVADPDLSDRLRRNDYVFDRDSDSKHGDIEAPGIDGRIGIPGPAIKLN